MSDRTEAGRLCWREVRGLSVPLVDNPDVLAEIRALDLGERLSNDDRGDAKFL